MSSDTDVQTSLEARVQWIEDYLAIRELTARYNHTFDDGDAEAFADCWTEDGRMTHEVPGSHGGREEFIASCKLYDGGVIHQTSDPIITIDGDTATQDCSFQVWTRLKDRSANEPFMTGRYQDELVRTPDGWKFHRRFTKRDLIGRTLRDVLGLPAPEH
jgi:ketosteroid isomerase-like protein